MTPIGLPNRDLLFTQIKTNLRERVIRLAQHREVSMRLVNRIEGWFLRLFLHSLAASLIKKTDVLIGFITGEKAKAWLVYQKDILSPYSLLLTRRAEPGLLRTNVHKKWYILRVMWKYRVCMQVYHLCLVGLLLLFAQSPTWDRWYSSRLQ